MISWLKKHFFKIIILLWICTLTELLVSHKYLVFLRQEFALLILAGVLMMILFLVTDTGIKKLTLEMKLRGGILSLPLLYMLFAQGASLDSYAFEKRNIQSLLGIPMEVLESHQAGDISSTDQLPSTEGDVVPATLLSLFQSPLLYQDKSIITTGMVYRDLSLPENQFMLFRFSVACCAADAIPLAVKIETQDSLTIENNIWVQIKGRFDLDKKNNTVMPVIRNAKVEKTLTPQRPYL